jgi:hypothetical protein
MSTTIITTLTSRLLVASRRRKRFYNLAVPLTFLLSGRERTVVPTTTATPPALAFVHHVYILPWQTTRTVTRRHLPCPVFETTTAIAGLVSCPLNNNDTTELNTKTNTNMPRGIKKENLPSKVCVTCGRPFTWRKKWERVWDDVTTCSKSCNRKRRDTSHKHNTSKQAAEAEAESSPFASDECEELIVDGSESESRSVTLIRGECCQSDKGATQNESEVFLSEEGAGAEAETETVEALSSDDLTLATLLANTSLPAEDETASETSFQHELEDQDEDDSSATATQNVNDDDPVERRKAERKAAKKAKKAERRAQRQGNGDPMAGRKPCDVCSKPVNLLVRCTTDASRQQYQMVCGKCWKDVSGGVVDGDAAHPHYNYGGLWKNRRAQQA